MAARHATGIPGGPPRTLRSVPNWGEHHHLYSTVQAGQPIRNDPSRNFCVTGQMALFFPLEKHAWAKCHFEWALLFQIGYIPNRVRQLDPYTHHVLPLAVCLCVSCGNRTHLTTLKVSLLLVLPPLPPAGSLHRKPPLVLLLVSPPLPPAGPLHRKPPLVLLRVSPPLPPAGPLHRKPPLVLLLVSPPLPPAGPLGRRPPALRVR